MNFKALIASLLAASIAAAADMPQPLPKGWNRSGSPPAADVCDVKTDSMVRYSGQRSLTLNCAKKEDGFVTVMQQIKADDFRGKRVKFSAHVQSNKVVGAAGLWMRVDSASGVTAFDNMQNRPIAGTSDWTEYDVVLDVGTSATIVNFGILMNGVGQVWMDDIKFEPVSDAVPVTSLTGDLPNAPTNLDLRN